MTLDQLHMEIAKERFLEMMAAEPDSEVGPNAVDAIEQADEFISAYKALGPEACQSNKPERKMKGCAKCFGSGGKASAPCKACHGTGKVAA